LTESNRQHLPYRLEPKILHTHLSCDVLVREPNDHAVLGSVVFILILDDKPLTSVVVSSALTTPLELNLETLEVCLVLHDLHETLCKTINHYFTN
jgi:hypothetical protein